MLKHTGRLALAAAVGLGLAVSGGVAKAETPKKGGILSFVVASDLPSFDGHRETTFGVIHPLAPIYSLLIRVNPANPGDPTDFECDLCVGKVPTPENDGKKYTFKLRKGVKFHDGTPLTSADVKATYDKIIFPPEGVPSARKSYYRMVDKISTPDDHTIVFDLKFASASFIPSMANPYNWIYSKKDLDAHGMEWHTKNVNGSGPFKFVQYQPGAFVEGVRNEDFYMEGRPYLDGFRSIIAPKMAVRLQAIRGDRAAIEFRGFPPKARDDLVKALGDKVMVQESDWNCNLLATPNTKRPGISDKRVRQALTLGVDRWGGSEYLSQIAIVKTVGGVVFPSHPLAATKDELTKLKGYGTDIEASRAEAKKLLAEAGHSDLKVNFSNRGVDQPYKVVGTWLVDQWRKIGVTADQRVQPSGPFYDTLRKTKDFDVSIDFNCQAVIDPVADITKFLPSSGSNYADFEDAELESIYAQIEKEGDNAKLRALIRKYETRALSDLTSSMITLWWYKINVHRSYVKGWKIAPSHYLAQQLDPVWLDK